MDNKKDFETPQIIIFEFKNDFIITESENENWNKDTELEEINFKKRI